MTTTDSGRVMCSKCGADEVISYMAAATAICPNCCDDHEYEYERSDRTHYCQHCGAEPPADWYYCEDDVGLGPFAAAEPLGVPASEMCGNASVANASPKNRRKWDNWVAFCDSWGCP
jgi:NMD protein affecting ribosome stability and mRNA decay